MPRIRYRPAATHLIFEIASFHKAIHMFLDVSDLNNLIREVTNLRLNDQSPSLSFFASRHLLSIVAQEALSAFVIPGPLSVWLYCHFIGSSPIISRTCSTAKPALHNVRIPQSTQIRYRLACGSDLERIVLVVGLSSTVTLRAKLLKIFHFITREKFPLCRQGQP